MTLRVATAINLSQQPHQTRLVGMFFAILVVTMAFMGVQTRGQEAKFDSIPMIDAFKNEDTIKRMERAAAAFSSHRDVVANFKDLRVAQAYFTRYLPAKMTQPDALEEVSKSVQDAMGYLSRAQRSGVPGANEMLKWVYIGMKQVAEGNYAPIARINATLVLGRLDIKQADQIKQQPPVPLTVCLPILIQLYEDEANAEGIRAAALHGIRRYVTYGFYYLKPDERTKLTQLMTQLLDAPVPQNRSKKAHAFLQRYAVDILDYARTGAAPDLAKQLVSISADPKRPNLIALYSAARVGQMKELQGQVESPSTILESWSARVWLSLQDELKRMQSLERPTQANLQPSSPDSHLQVTDKPKKTPSGGRNGMRMGMGGPGMEGMEDGMMGPEMMMADSGMEGMAMGPGGGGRGRSQMEMDGMMMMDMEGFAGGSANTTALPQAPEVIASRKRLLFIIQQLYLGASGSPNLGIPKTPAGLLASVAEKDKVVVEKWLSDMKAVVESLNDQSNADELLFMEALVAQIEVLKEMAGPVAIEIEQAAAREMSGIPADKAAQAPTDAVPEAPAASPIVPAGPAAAPASVAAPADGNAPPAAPGDTAEAPAADPTAVEDPATDAAAAMAPEAPVLPPVGDL
ncbi:hypothetical protein Pla52o_09960 [Novipirellula galeiformis]|uniref:Uncharacterized protein n=1 Tax=Novipirellula galeiformis TaxID=2528004 RepID=A0A5C6CVY6_9BACT|nr:hypothetical protein Pla52o_09960 [Novipirellula galeiformis]